MNKVYIGYDKREDDAYKVCKYSILKHSPTTQIEPIIQEDMRNYGLYTREEDKKASTDFSLTRFLTPSLAKKGWALFMDCDMLVTKPIDLLFEYADPKYAVMVVKHNHQPFDTLKMDGRDQFLYPRKNWSSVILFNCDHKANYELECISNTATPSFLHRFKWLEDHEIGELPITFNFLVDYYKKPSNGVVPNIIHYTGGGPWFDDYKDVDYAQGWLNYKEEMEDD